MQTHIKEEIHFGKLFSWHHFKGVKHKAKFNWELLNVYIYLQGGKQESFKVIEISNFSVE